VTRCMPGLLQAIVDASRYSCREGARVKWKRQAREALCRQRVQSSGALSRSITKDRVLTAIVIDRTLPSLNILQTHRHRTSCRYMTRLSLRLSLLLVTAILFAVT